MTLKSQLTRVCKYSASSLGIKRAEGHLLMSMVFLAVIY